VPLLKRYGYVKDTIATLDQAKRLSGGGFSRELDGRRRTYEASRLLSPTKAAQEELAWCLEHADKAPSSMAAQVYYHLGKLVLNDGDTARPRSTMA
jgi:hypothetical protein